MTTTREMLVHLAAAHDVIRGDYFRVVFSRCLGLDLRMELCPFLRIFLLTFLFHGKNTMNRWTIRKMHVSPVAKFCWSTGNQNRKPF